jgi:hypothetical protein
MYPGFDLPYIAPSYTVVLFCVSLVVLTDA